MEYLKQPEDYTVRRRPRDAALNWEKENYGSDQDDPQAEILPKGSELIRWRAAKCMAATARVLRFSSPRNGAPDLRLGRSRISQPRQARRRSDGRNIG
jgi:hypothetical protein